MTDPIRVREILPSMTAWEKPAIVDTTAECNTFPRTPTLEMRTQANKNFIKEKLARDAARRMEQPAIMADSRRVFKKPRRVLPDSGTEGNIESPETNALFNANTETNTKRRNEDGIRTMMGMLNYYGRILTPTQPDAEFRRRRAELRANSERLVEFQMNQGPLALISEPLRNLILAEIRAKVETYVDGQGRKNRLSSGAGDQRATSQTNKGDVISPSSKKEEMEDI